MNDPRRLLEEATDVTDSERRLLVAGSAATPPAELSAELWAALATKLPAAHAGAAESAGGALKGAKLALLLKAGLALITLGALVLGARAWLFGESAALPTAPAPSALPLVASQAPHASPSPAPDAPVEAASAAPVASVLHAASAAHSGKLLANSHSAASVASAASTSSNATEESLAVTAARNALRGGNSASALAILSQAQQRFGTGVLGQEREALTIEALAKSGQAAAARTRARAFLTNYANSPYAARLRALTGAN